jgi:hypothetical protein
MALQRELRRNRSIPLITGYPATVLSRCFSLHLPVSASKLSIYFSIPLFIDAEEIELGEFVLDDLEGAMEIAGTVENMQSFGLFAAPQAFCAQDVIFLQFDLFAHGPLPPWNFSLGHCRRTGLRK